MMISRFIAAACVFSARSLAPPTVTASMARLPTFHFQVPGALGTYPMSINNSMTVTGYYYVSPTETRGFLRDADGTITTFDVDVAGVVWTEPESINARGNITGFYELAATPPQPPYDFTGINRKAFSGTPTGASSNSPPPKSSYAPDGRIPS